MTKKKNKVNLSVYVANEPEFRETIETLAEQLGWKPSTLLRRLAKYSLAKLHCKDLGGYLEALRDLS